MGRSWSACLTNSFLILHVLPDCFEHCFFYSTSHGGGGFTSHDFTDCGTENGILQVLWWLGRISCCSLLRFPFCMSVRMQRFVSDNGCSDNNCDGAGDDMSHRTCTGSVAQKKKCDVTWLVEASGGPHTSFLIALLLLCSTQVINSGFKPSVHQTEQRSQTVQYLYFFLI